MRSIGGEGTPFATYDLTVVESDAGKWIPVHGSVKMPSVESPEKAAYELMEYWHDLPDEMKFRFDVGNEIKEYFAKEISAMRENKTVVALDGKEKMNALDVLRAFHGKTLVSDLYDNNQEFSEAIANIFGDSFEYPDFSHRTIDQVVKMAEKKMGLGVVPVVPLFDPLSVEGYAQVMASPKLQLARQDELDSFFSGRIVDVRNSLRDLGWGGQPRSFTLAKDDFCVGFDAVHVGAGRNVVGGKWQLAQIDNPRFVTAHGDKVAVVDDLKLDAQALAGEIDAMFVREKNRILENSKLSPQELTLGEFSEIAKIQKLESHGRKWSVSFAGTDLGFADAPSKLDVFREVHSNEVNNALYAHSADAPDFLKGTVFPADAALAEYPEMRERFADVFEVADSLINSVPALAKIGPAFGIGQNFDFKVGDAIVANGFRGSVGKVLDGQLAGMLEVRLPGGVACVSGAFPDCFPAYNNGVEVVTDGKYSGPVKEVSGQFVVQSVGRGRLVAHECHRFDELPAVGDSIDLQHRGGKVSFVREQDKGRGNER